MISQNILDCISRFTEITKAVTRLRIRPVRECFNTFFNPWPFIPGDTDLVGSTLSDPYLSYSAALFALAGPLHGFVSFCRTS